MKLHEFFDKHQWTQGTCARNASGQAVMTKDESACKFCALGALYVIYGDPIPEDVLNSVAEVFEPGFTGDNMTVITTYNDRHTQDEVLSLLRKANV